MKNLVFAGLLLGSATSVHAVDANSAMSDYIRAQASAVTKNPVIIAAITAQNARTAGLSQADIHEMDQVWRAEVGTQDTPLISSVTSIPASQALTGFVEQTAGMITEVFVMDARGLNVATSAVTSDYWQGDEAKFLQTFPIGPNAVHVSEIEFDESTQLYQAQISVTIADPETRMTIGAVTFGLNAQSFF
jgi:hypothetical protein